MQFEYYNPTRILFGAQQIAQLNRVIPAEARVLVLYGGGSIKRNGVYDQVTEALEGRAWSEFGGIEPNPAIETLNQAVERVRAEKVDFLLAVGGGSVIDGTKYVAAAACYEGDGWDILTGRHTVTEAVPLGAVLTLPATGSESNAGSVVSRKATQEKLFFMSPAVIPQFAVLDPDVIRSLPERQKVNGIVDAFVHVSEQYITAPNDAWVQSGYAETLLRVLVELGRNRHSQTDAWRANLMWAANQALNGLIGSGVAQDWATHMIGHELTARYGVDHARSLAIVQPWLLRDQIEAKRARLNRLGTVVFNLADGPDLAERTVDAIEAFYHGLEVETRLTDYGESKEEAITAILEQLERHNMVALGESQSITLDVSRRILEQAIA
ncbi:MAG: iron-containing alcohol dehydrogenase [Gammaproteobacteria bacterium]|nr:MAG: iron-containing alcohol dehydrogenase [Gammaproteobacteria bacterium]